MVALTEWISMVDIVKGTGAESIELTQSEIDDYHASLAAEESSSTPPNGVILDLPIQLKEE